MSMDYMGYSDRLAMAGMATGNVMAAYACEQGLGGGRAVSPEINIAGRADRLGELSPPPTPGSTGKSGGLIR